MVLSTTTLTVPRLSMRRRAIALLLCAGCSSSVAPDASLDDDAAAAPDVAPLDSGFDPRGFPEYVFVARDCPDNLIEPAAELFLHPAGPDEWSLLFHAFPSESEGERRRGCALREAHRIGMEFVLERDAFVVVAGSRDLAERMRHQPFLSGVEQADSSWR